jgi:hypothetical protein
MTAPVSPSAPVAWRRPAISRPGWTLTENPDVAAQWQDDSHKVQALGVIAASPAPSMVGLREDVLERLKCAAETNAGHWPIEDGRAGVTIRLEDLRDCLALLAREGVGG